MQCNCLTYYNWGYCLHEVEGEPIEMVDSTKEDKLIVSGKLLERIENIRVAMCYPHGHQQCINWMVELAERRVMELCEPNRLTQPELDALNSIKARYGKVAN